MKSVINTEIDCESLLESAGVKGACLRSMSPEGGIDGDPDGRNDIYRSYALLPRQTHSLNVGVVKNRDDVFPETDALITFKSGLPIGVLTADCVPIIIFAGDVKGIAVVHAGWKGTLGGIVDNTIDVLESYGANTSEMTVAFGPSISMNRYEVDEDLADKFINAGFNKQIVHSKGKEAKPHIDLQGVNVERLLKRGVPKENIRLHDGCSFDSRYEDGRHKYYSHRRSGGGLGRNLTVIMKK